MNETLNTKNTVSLTAVGDILLHGRVYGGLNKKSGYILDEQMKNASGLLGKSDITIANLENVIGGNELGLSAFPRFNAPVEIAGVLKDLGVNMINLANNHILDKGEIGILKTIQNLEKVDLEYLGAYKSEEDRERLRIVNKNGLRICFFSYTQGTNYIKVPDGKSYLVNTLKNISLFKIQSTIRKIKSRDIADVVVVNMHFGEEYHLYPSHRQRELAASISDAGADVIIGHHPHVLQPPEWIENSLGNKTFVAYSLGNFFSGQNGLYRQIGAALSLEITKLDKDSKQIVIKNPKYDLTFVKREDKRRYDLYVMRDWIKDNKYIETSQGKFSSEEVYENVKKRMSSAIKDLEIN